MVVQYTRDYELLIVLSPEATEDEVSSIVERIHGFISKNGGKVENHDIWGVRQLAFPIKKFREGNYILTRFVSDPGKVQEITLDLNSSEDILRFLITNTIQTKTE